MNQPPWPIATTRAVPCGGSGYWSPYQPGGTSTSTATPIGNGPRLPGVGSSILPDDGNGCSSRHDSVAVTRNSGAISVRVPPPDLAAARVSAGRNTSGPSAPRPTPDAADAASVPARRMSCASSGVQPIPFSAAASGDPPSLAAPAELS